jgi:hypothetical protein
VKDTEMPESVAKMVGKRGWLVSEAAKLGESGASPAIGLALSARRLQLSETFNKGVDVFFTPEEARSLAQELLAAVEDA